ncbi:MAG: OmpA family protein [Deltaproteobacteria bacterium]|nr:OmpA family protein [Deltaproteobacteria bacterium]
MKHIGFSGIAALGLTILATAAAHAGENPQRNSLTFRPSPHAGDLFGVHTARAPESTVTGGLWLTLNDKPLKVSDVQSGAEVRLVARQWVGEAYAAIGLAQRLSLGLNLPLFLDSSGSALPAELGLQQVSGSSVGDARVSLRYVALDGGRDGLGLAIAQDIGVPTATARNFSGDAGVTSETRLIADLPMGPLHLALNLGFAARQEQVVLGHAYGNQWLAGAGASYSLMCGRLDALGTLEGRTAAGDPLGDFHDGQLDGLAGARLRLGDLALTAAAGGGLAQGFGAAAFRASLGLAWLPQDPAVCNPDADGDGVGAAADRCPAEAGPSRSGGCPDDDGDGLGNREDRCPQQAGVAMYGGCTPTDSDGDGVADHEDRCRMAAGSAGFKGCPDSDGDGLSDLDDRCPKHGGEVAKGGCPPDEDGDGVYGADDKCPDVAGTAERQGCSDQRVVVTKQKIAISERVFFETGQERIMKESLSLLDEVAQILKQNPQVKRVRIEGHSDNVGDAAENLRLSGVRAAAVKKYLVGKGVAAKRLESQGFGDVRPLGDNATEEGRAQNRRVEFVIVERGE